MTVSVLFLQTRPLKNKLNSNKDEKNKVTNDSDSLQLAVTTNVNYLSICPSVRPEEIISTIMTVISSFLHMLH